MRRILSAFLLQTVKSIYHLHSLGSRNSPHVQKSHLTVYFRQGIILGYIRVNKHFELHGYSLIDNVEIDVVAEDAFFHSFLIMYQCRRIVLLLALTDVSQYVGVFAQVAQEKRIQFSQLAELPLVETKITSKAFWALEATSLI